NGGRFMREPAAGEFLYPPFGGGGGHNRKHPWLFPFFGVRKPPNYCAFLLKILYPRGGPFPRRHPPTKLFTHEIYPPPPPLPVSRTRGGTQPGRRCRAARSSAARSRIGSRPGCRG